MRAIPRKLLIHDATLYRVSENDRWGKTQMDEGTHLTSIRIEPSGSIIRDKNNAEIRLAATLFFDCQNSRPQGIGLLVDDIIVFNGQKHQVKLVEPLYDEKRLHHYELGLVAYA